MLFTGVAVAQGSMLCSVRTDGPHIQINCDECFHENAVTWQSIVVLLVGALFVLFGLAAAIYRSERVCKVYGVLMLMLSFVIGLAALLTGLDCAIIASAAERVPMDDAMCRAHADGMLHATQLTTALYAINAALALAAAVFAIKSRLSFSLHAVSAHHANFHKSYQTL
jgi:lysylphosphatidylglycerol synthetase-like protein (DUF2156 family)